MTVRLATVDDVEGLLDVIGGVVEEGRWLGAEPPFDRDERRQRIVTAIEERSVTHFAALSEDGQVVGHLGMELARYGVAQFGMCVADGWRGQGVGSALVEAAVEEARGRGAHKVAIQVWPHNGPARRLYRRLGFVEEGRLHRHYPRSNGELWDAVMMGLVLDTTRPGSPHPDEQ